MERKQNDKSVRCVDNKNRVCGKQFLNFMKITQELLFTFVCHCFCFLIIACFRQQINLLVANALLRDYSNFTYFYVTKLSCKTKPCKTVLNLNIHKVWVLSSSH